MNIFQISNEQIVVYLPRELPKGIEVKSYGIVHWNIADDLFQVYYLAIKNQHMFLTYLMHCCHLNIEYGTKIEQLANNILLHDSIESIIKHSTFLHFAH